MGGTTIPTPDDYMVELIKNQYIEPTHPGEDIEYVAVTTPAGGVADYGTRPPHRVRARAAERLGAWWRRVWPDEPWWKLSGLFDLTVDQSLQAGLGDLETAMAEHGNDHLVIYGASQGSIDRDRGEAQASEQYPDGNQGPRHRLRYAGHA